jgi:hypothetical protein
MGESITINGRVFPVVSGTFRPEGQTVAEAKPPKAAVTRRAFQRPFLQGEAVASGTLALSALPPSLNHAFANANTGRIKSIPYKDWLAYSHVELRTQPAWHVAGETRVLLLFNREKTKADIDNLIKPTLDLLVAAGRMSDDRNVTQLSAYFSSGVGGVVIEIQAVRP